jgi:hypothetical protein
VTNGGNCIALSSVNTRDVVEHRRDWLDLVRALELGEGGVVIALVEVLDAASKVGSGVMILRRRLGGERQEDPKRKKNRSCNHGP